MKVKVVSYKIVCDCCGETFHDGNDLECFSDDPDGGLIRDEALTANWREIDGKHYCPDCWTWDDDYNIECKDGRKYDEDGNRVDKNIFVEDLGEGTQLQVKAILVIEKMKQWFNGLSDKEKAKFAEEYPEFVTIDKED